MNEQDVEELVKIIVEGFMTDPNVRKFNQFKPQAMDSFKKAILGNKEHVETSLKRFHYWMHAHGIGEEKYPA